MKLEDGPHVGRAKARVGAVLKDKWTLDALLGIGGMAAVYAATHRNGMRVAIKVLHFELSLEEADRARFLREGYIANTVDHPGVASVLDDDVTEDGLFFLVMELLDGETLHRQSETREAQLTPAEVLCIADQILDVLAAAHAKGVVHRDLKPDNVFITRSGNLKILDFGIARLRELSGHASISGSGRATMGTPAYMPPEQARARWELVDARTDLWALGATMFSLLTSRHVQEALTVNELLLLRMTQPIPSLATVAPEMDPAVVHIVDRALSFNQEGRWPDARAMQEAVREAYVAVTGVPHETACRHTLDPSLSSGRHSALPLSARVLPPAVGSGKTERPPRRALLVALSLAGGIAVPGLALALWAALDTPPRDRAAPLLVAASPSAPAAAAAPVGEALATPAAADATSPAVAAAASGPTPPSSATAARPTPAQSAVTPAEQALSAAKAPAAAPSRRAPAVRAPAPSRPSTDKNPAPSPANDPRERRK